VISAGSDPTGSPGVQFLGALSGYMQAHLIPSVLGVVVIVLCLGMLLRWGKKAVAADRANGDWSWDGDEVHFTRPGASGFMRVSATSLVLEVRLGLLLSPLRPAIERQMNAHLDALEGDSRRA